MIYILPPLKLTYKIYLPLFHLSSSDLFLCGFQEYHRFSPLLYRKLSSPPEKMEEKEWKDLFLNLPKQDKISFISMMSYIFHSGKYSWALITLNLNFSLHMMRLKSVNTQCQVSKSVYTHTLRVLTACTLFLY